MSGMGAKSISDRLPRPTAPGGRRFENLSQSGAVLADTIRRQWPVHAGRKDDFAGRAEERRPRGGLHQLTRWVLRVQWRDPDAALGRAVAEHAAPGARVD